MANLNTLQASHPANKHAVRHGAFSRTGRVLEPRVQDLVNELSQAPHITALDALAVREAAQLTALIEALDHRILERLRVGNREPTTLLDLRQRYSRRLADWLDRLGCTPAGRASWAKAMAEGATLAEEIARRRAGKE